ncbi:hypothetical protein [Paraburkholderia sp. GAS334]|jgi:hypothetical protein
MISALLDTIGALAVLASIAAKIAMIRASRERSVEHETLPPAAPGHRR